MNAIEGNWQPIDTAPRGTRVILLDKKGNVSINDFGLFFIYNEPGFTHWMPIHKLPKP